MPAARGQISRKAHHHWLDAIIDPAAHRESDLLAFQIAIERSQPGAIMSGYNKVNGDYAGGNKVLLRDVLKDAFGYRGWVMSDWGATPSWEFALAGLDQESGVQLDTIMWGSQPFTEPLRKAYADGEFPNERLSEMARRILRSMYAVGIDTWDGQLEVDLAAHNEIALETARQGIVLLKNDGALPLGADEPLKVGSSAATPTSGCPAAPVQGRSCRMGGSRPCSRSVASVRWAPATTFPHAVVAAHRAQEAAAQRAGRLRPGREPGRGGAAGQALGRGRGVRDPGRG